jgi:thiol-disulfide isomerase/thioredoxin
MELTVPANGATGSSGEPLVLLGRSFSGYERNKLFLNLGGKDFADLSMLSGVDSVADSRSFAWLDYDRDGFTDIALVNANTPWINLFHNETGSLIEDGAIEPRHVVAVRLVGGNRGGFAAPGLTNRDAIGANVRVTTGTMTQLRERRCGDGFAAQNSPTLLVGLGAATVADRVEVEWPSGVKQTIEKVAHGSLLTFHEPATPDVNGGAIEVSEYLSKTPVAKSKHMRNDPESLDMLHPPGAIPTAEFRLYATMATWCAACAKEGPHFAKLRAAFEPSELAIFGAPFDPKDTTAQLESWSAKFAPQYTLLADVPTPTREKLRDYVKRRLDTVAVPVSILADRNGRWVHGWLGTPSISDVRRVIDGAR